MFAPPRLSTSRLVLREPVETDLDDLFTHIQDYEVARNTLNIPHPYERHMADDWLAMIQDTFEKRLGYQFAITLPSTNRLIGSIGFSLIARHQRAEIGYWIGKTYRNQGYVTEALKRVIQFCFDELPLNRLQATHFTYNPASGRVMEKAGMTYECTLSQYVMKWDKPEDLAMYAITRDQWLAQGS